MGKIDIEKIMAELISDSGADDSNTDNTDSNPDSQVNDLPTFDDSTLDGMSVEELFGLLESYQNQFLEMLQFKSFEPAFSEYGSLQEELNRNYRIMNSQQSGDGIIRKLCRKILGLNDILAKQEQFNAMATRIMNRNIEINTSVAREIFQLRTQLFFISIQARISSRILKTFEQSLTQHSLEQEHRNRREEYMSTIVPKIYKMLKELKHYSGNELDMDNCPNPEK